MNGNNLRFDRVSEFSGTDRSWPEINAVPKKQTDLSSDIPEVEHPLDYFDNSSQLSNFHNAVSMLGVNCSLETEPVTNSSPETEPGFICALETEPGFNCAHETEPEFTCALETEPGVNSVPETEEVELHVLRNECGESTESGSQSNESDTDWTVAVNSEPNDATDRLFVIDFDNSLHLNAETPESTPTNSLSAQRPLGYLSMKDDTDTTVVALSTFLLLGYWNKMSWKLFYLLLILLESFTCTAIDVLGSSLISYYNFFDRSLQLTNSDETQLPKLVCVWQC